MTTEPILYSDLASWWPLLSAPADYAEEAAFYAETLGRYSPSKPRTLLELGSGGGNNASHLKRAFDEVTLVDLSPGMLEVSRALNPECDHHLGDMRSVRLGRRFDSVFVHDAICYVTTLEDLRAVMETVHVHCRPGGVALIAPDFTRESFRPSTSHGGHDGEERALRYLQWSRAPGPSDRTYVVEYAYLLREADGTVQVRHDRHVEGLFTREEWVQTLERVGFVAEAVPHRHSDVPYETVVFVGTRAVA